VTVLLAGLLLPAAVLAADPPGLDRFMYSVGRVESGGRYTARNPISGAYGKYQIIPSSWRAWARQYLGSAYAPPTPRNQERVARAKMKALYRWLDSWRAVAHWWLTGRGERNPDLWTGYARRYVGRIMTIYGSGRKAPAGLKPTVQETSATIAYSGSWASARHAGYSGDRVKYARAAGATATLTFTGTKVTWIGPVGPTRGKARILVDGVAVKVVNLYAGTFRAQKALFSASFATAGEHTLTIKVLGTRGHPLVAIDGFAIVR
jgi:hypothetical protein